MIEENDSTAVIDDNISLSMNMNMNMNDNNNNNNNDDILFKWDRVLQILKDSSKWETARQKFDDMRKEAGELPKSIKRRISEKKEKFRGDVKRKVDKFKSRLTNEKDKIENKIKLKQKEIQIKFESNVRLVDKLGFFFGVINSWLTVFFWARYPKTLIRWCGFWCGILIAIRIVVYRLKVWHYYLFDFCYYSNLLLLSFIYLFPFHLRLFKVVFAFANGPLLWAMVLWRNSLVFHDIDKLTSLFIHLAGPLITFTIRWQLPGDTSAEKYYSFLTDCPSKDDCDLSMSWYDSIILPLGPYIVWQIAYYLKTECNIFRISRKVAVSEDDEIVTSFKMLSSVDGCISRLWTKYPRPFRVIAFMIWQLIYTLLTLLPVKFMFQSMYVHLIVLGLSMTICIWNGSNYYFDIFARRYEDSMKNHDTKLRELREEYEKRAEEFDLIFKRLPIN